MTIAEIRKTEIYKRRAMASTHPENTTISLSAFDDENELVAFTDLTIEQAVELQDELQQAIQSAENNHSRQK